MSTKDPPSKLNYASKPGNEKGGGYAEVVNSSLPSAGAPLYGDMKGIAHEIV